MSTYLRSVLFRLTGAFAGMAIGLGFIVLALANFDTPAGLPEELRATWPFWGVALVIAIGVFLVRRRLGSGPGWGAFAIGIVAPLVGLFVNATVGGGGGFWFWMPVLAIIVVPLPRLRSDEQAQQV